MVPSRSMPLPAIAVVIPTLNEEQLVARAIASARGAGVTEIVVADGGSSDRTVEIATASGARVLTLTRSVRARQLNEGAAATTSEVLLFLHADTTLPTDAARAIADAVARGHDCGGFRLRFAEAGGRLRIAERMINARTRLTRCPWGDHAQFATREAFDALCGFRDIAIMEDYDFALRARQQRRPTILESYVTTSGRRFIERGIARTVATNWRIIAGFHMGEDPEALARRYRSRATRSPQQDHRPDASRGARDRASD